MTPGSAPSPSGELEALLRAVFAAEEDASDGCGFERRLALGDDSGQAAHLEACADCASAIDWLGEVDDIWATAPTPMPAPLAAPTSSSGVRADGISAIGGAPTRAPRRSWMAPMFAVAAALLLTVGVVRLVVAPDAPTVVGPAGSGHDDHRLTPKGASFELRVAVARSGAETFWLGGAQSPSASAQTLRTGDRLGLFYNATAQGRVAVFYGTPRGGFDALLRADADGSAVRPGTNVALPAGGVLSPPDAGVEPCEWIVALYSDGAGLIHEVAAGAVDRMWRGRSGCELAPSALDGVDVQVLQVGRGASLDPGGRK